MGHIRRRLIFGCARTTVCVSVLLFRALTLTAIIRPAKTGLADRVIVTHLLGWRICRAGAFAEPIRSRGVITKRSIADTVIDSYDD
jgi:hypothetical protein